MTETGTISLVHPQPVGAFGFPAGLLLVAGTAADVDACRRDLVEGRLPAVWPEALRGHALVHQGRLDQAASVFSGPDPVSRYHRWLLDPEADDAAAVRAGLPVGLAALVDVVAYTIGLGPVPEADHAELPDEVAALVLAAQATAALEVGDPVTAARTLVAGAQRAGDDSPALAAVLLGNAGTLAHEHGQPSQAREALTQAAAALDGSDLREVRAELLHQLGSIAHEEAASGRGDERALLQEAMGHYYDALQLVSEASSPYLWASINMNLATAQLATPMTQASDQLRLGIATQLLRAARRVFSAEETPGPWSTATLNLANALVYTPSTHQGDNLVEAVELYEEVLESGVRDADPVGRARLLANQGNALAHLGIFGPATAKLMDARQLFEEAHDHDAVMSVRGVLNEIARAQVGDPDDDPDSLARRAEQMSRIPTSDAPRTAGMSVTVTAGDLTAPPPRPRVTRLEPGQTHPSMPPEQR
ncbi:MAG: hypothetical protein U0R80_13175 [Nocardioidaceae bacterium]